MKQIDIKLKMMLSLTTRVLAEYAFLKAFHLDNAIRESFLPN